VSVSRVPSGSAARVISTRLLPGGTGSPSLSQPQVKTIRVHGSTSSRCRGRRAVHGWDLATATGQSFTADEDVVATAAAVAARIADGARVDGAFVGPEAQAPRRRLATGAPAGLHRTRVPQLT